MRRFDDDLYCGPENDDEEPGCPTCGASLYWEECDQCEDGYSGPDCGDDTCCCLYPEENVRCDQCNGYGGWWRCLERHDGQRCYLPNELSKEEAP